MDVFHAQVVFFSFISGTLGLSLYSYMEGMNVCILVPLNEELQ